MPVVLVIGGLGLMGRPVVAELLRRKLSLRLFTSRRDVAGKIFGDQVEYAEGDVCDPADVKAAVQGCDTVYVSLKGGPTPKEYVQVELGGAKNIYAAAREAGVAKIVQMSEARADADHTDFIITRIKYEAQQALTESGLNYVVLKPTWFFESLPLSIQHNKAILVGTGKTSFFFLAAADYADIVGRCFESDKADNKILTLFGPEPMPISEAMRRFLEIVHPDVTIDHLPVWMARFVSMFSFDKSLRMAIRMMAYYDRHGDDEVAVGPEEADRLFGRCPTTVEQWSRAYRKVIKGV